MFNKLSKKRVMSMDEVIAAYIKEMKIASGLNRQRIFAAWDAVSGASAYTVSKYVKNNVLYCGISSSVIRNRLFLNRDLLVRRINEFLLSDELFIKDDPDTGLVKAVILK